MSFSEHEQDDVNGKISKLTRENLHILIIGAGSTGLLIGQGLKQAGIQCTIYEKTTRETYRHRTRDWSMGVHWASDFLKNGLPASVIAKLESADTARGLEITPYQQAYTPILNGKTGELFFTVDAISTKRFSRARLRDALSEGLAIRYGHELTSITVPQNNTNNSSSIQAHFTNTTTATGTHLIGCDSATSPLRTLLLTKPLASTTDMPIIAYNFTHSYPTPRALWLKSHSHPIMKCAPHPDQPTWHFICTLDARSPDPSQWVFQLFLHLWTSEPPPDTSAGRLAHFKHLASAYAEPFHSAAAWVQPDTYVAFDRIKQWERPIPWPNHGGRVTLAGDAAHPMAPHRAQGLNHALQDAVLYTKAIKEAVSGENSGSEEDGLRKRLQEAIDQYDEEVFARGSKEIQVSAKQAYAAMHWDVYLESPTVKFGHRVVEQEVSI
ncbi:MAG: hypothetical protein Q9227_004498 [Pyrenula ochraceoflavens]